MVTTASAPVLVIGAGSWGTALALQLGRINPEVRLWAHNAQHLERMATERCNTRFLPEILFPDSLVLCSKLEQAVTGVRDILLAVPSSALSEVLSQLALVSPADPPRFIIATKGFAPNGKLMHEYLLDRFGAETQFCFLSGPSFAAEVAQNLPTTVTLSSQNVNLAQQVRARLHAGHFRVYINDDIISTQIGGACKNIMAIAAGIADGLSYGANARAALLTRGLHEMTRLSVALGGQTETMAGLAGLGDLILTCTGNLSRNRRFGLALGAGHDQHQAAQEVGQVVEGVEAVKHVHSLEQSLQLDLPICRQIYRILMDNLPVNTAVEELFAREPKLESLS